MVRSLQQGKKLRLFSDEIRSPADAQSAAEGLLLSLAQNEKLIHLGGPGAVSRHDMGVELQKILNVSPFYTTIGRTIVRLSDRKSG